MSDPATAIEAAPGLPGYAPGAAWDEAVDEAGRIRPLYRPLLGALAGADLGAVAEAIAADLSAAGIGFTGPGGDETFHVDPVPRLVSSEEWSRIVPGLAQRARALGAYVADVYGDREIVAAGVVPARVIETSDYLEPWMQGIRPPLAGFVAGLDLVRGADGSLAVLEDNCRTPSGLAYVLAARAAIDAHLPFEPPADRLDPALGLPRLERALRAAAPAEIDDPSVVLLSDGPSNSAWYEHRAFASALGIPLVTAKDLLVRRGRLHAWVGEARTRPVDVVYRRTDEDRLMADGRATPLGDLLLAPLRAGTLAVVNPFGAGVADDKLAHAYVERMIRFYLNEEPLLPSVRSYDLGDPETLRAVMERLDELVIKPRMGFGGAGVVICPHATREDRDALRERVRAAPDGYIAQELVMLSTHPTVMDGRLAPRHVDLRPFVIGADDDAAVVPGGLTRVALGEGALVVNSSQDGGGKDTWVVGG